MLPSSLTRRNVLRVTGGTFGLSGLSGCIIGGFSDPPGGGDLVIFNSDSKEHTVTVTVSKVSESDDTRPKGETPNPEATPIWKRSERFTIPADDDLEQREFVTEPGSFFVVAELATGDRDTYWWGLYQASGGVAETALLLEIHNDSVSIGEGGA